MYKVSQANAVQMVSHIWKIAQCYKENAQLVHSFFNAKMINFTGINQLTIVAFKNRIDQLPKCFIIKLNLLWTGTKHTARREKEHLLAKKITDTSC